MINEPIFVIFFADGTHFFGGIDYVDTKWLDIPYKKIKRVTYKSPTGEYLNLENYDKYYHMVEALHDLNGKKAGQVQLQYVYLIGKKGKECFEFKMSFLNGKKKVVKNIYNETDKNITKLNPIGWKG